MNTQRYGRLLILTETILLFAGAIVMVFPTYKANMLVVGLSLVLLFLAALAILYWRGYELARYGVVGVLTMAAILLPLPSKHMALLLVPVLVSLVVAGLWWAMGSAALLVGNLAISGMSTPGISLLSIIIPIVMLVSYIVFLQVRQRKLEQQLRTVEPMQAAHAAMVGALHSMNQPLTAAIGFLELYATEPCARRDDRDLELIRAQLDQLTLLVRDTRGLLDIARDGDTELLHAYNHQTQEQV